MTSMLNARGLNDSGTWVNAACGFTFGYRPQAVLDLSPAGHQPIHSYSGRFTTSFNGEIYNHVALRAKLVALGV